MDMANIAIGSIAKLIELKVRHMDTNQELWDQFETLVSMMNVRRGADESETLMKEIANLLAKMEQTELPLAVRAMCEPGSRTHQHWRSYDVCLYCRHCQHSLLIPTKVRRTFHQDPLAAKQRLYCNKCGGRYRTESGKVIEIEIHGNFYYLKVDLPKADYLRLVDKLEPSTSSIDDMFAKLNHVTHQNQKTGLLGPIIEKEDVKYCSKTMFNHNPCHFPIEVYKSLPHLDWCQILLSQGLTHISP